MSKASQAASAFLKSFLAQNPDVKPVLVIPNNRRIRRASAEAVRKFLRNYLVEREKNK